MVLTLATTGKAHFPLWMESHSGNVSDKQILPTAANRMRTLCEGLTGTEDFLYVGDSALYTNILPYSAKMKWLTRVPEVIMEAKKLLATEKDELEWQALDAGYCYHISESNYQGVKQRGAMVFSEQAYRREIKTLDKNMAKEQANYAKLWWHLSNELFTCPDDAKKAIKGLTKKMKYHDVHTQITAVTGYAKKGRPGKGENAQVKGYKISAELFTDEAKVELIRRKKGRFILSTNELDKDKLKDSELLAEYKAQSRTESGFKFIKNNAFEVDSIFLKTPARIDALMMVMTLCLMVYGVSQYELHQSLADSGQTLPNQIRKATVKPSLKWIYFLFSGVQELTVALGETTQKLVINVSDLLKQVISHFGPRARAIYLNSS
jgi:transposase